MKKLILLIPLLISLQLHAQNKWQSEFDQFDQQDQTNPPPKEGVIVFTGSSSIRKWKAPDEMFDNPNIINRGFGGSEFSDLITNFEQVIGQYNPVQVVLYSGDNDVANGKSATTTYGDFCTLYGMLKAKLPDTKITVLSIKPSPSRWDIAETMQEANALIKDFATYRKDIDFIDIWTPMIGKNGKPIADLYVEDNLHMTDKGYEIWKEALGNHLVK